MRLVQTLVVRDEIDVVEAQLAYHLAAGVDFVLAADHESQDGTTDVLERHERDGHLRILRVSGPVREHEWRTEMARLAASEHGADWVINTDADEFWLPRRGTLKEAFAAVPPPYGVVWATSRHFVPRPDDGAPFYERMTVRFSAQAALNDPLSPYRPHAKAAHRADPDVVVRHGSHRAETRFEPLPHWHPFDVLHFPFRSLEQYERKTVRRARPGSDSRLGQYVRGLQAREQGRVGEVYAAMVVDDTMLERGLAAGSLVVDTRLRDALRGEPSRDEHTNENAADAAALRDAEIVRLLRFATDLRARLDRIERRRGARRP